jgi:hypothetical protein
MVPLKDNRSKLKVKGKRNEEWGIWLLFFPENILFYVRTTRYARMYAAS